MSHNEKCLDSVAWKEVEMKFRLQPKQFKEILLKLKTQCKMIRNETQIDYYFHHPIQKYFCSKITQKQDKYLRIRCVNDKSNICFKQWFFPDGTNKKGYCNEYEVEISDKDKILRIFRLLGFTPSLTIRKKRTFFMLDRHEIALDAVKGLGYFMEVEAKPPIFSEIKYEFDKIKTISRSYGIKDNQHEVLGYFQLAAENQLEKEKNHIQTCL